ncbi:hypothetical protein AB4Y32_24840 [Paraburkholderia phymatum]|uniref:Uncharacterized protein n=1 Tax=Paraburkholderia phymatum TaxID=148447 RepID=A0ACC6U5Q4_9BURK
MRSFASPCAGIRAARRIADAGGTLKQQQKPSQTKSRRQTPIPLPLSDKNLQIRAQQEPS